ncbi:MAG TPA: (2Fe-2S) ferredoxin domain-containing protein [Pyrinomonadaceae bacterium]|nr:(2Fe-2S) ferredoxin domain-containing protein [Pyrinomonadaceae bacterium]
MSLRLKKMVAHVLICTHKTCRKQGGKRVAKRLKRTLKWCGLSKSVMVSKVKCLGQCGRGPVVAVYPEGVWYGALDEDGARAIVEQHLAQGGSAEGVEVLCDMRAQGKGGK